MTLSELLSDVSPILLDAVKIHEDPTNSAAVQQDAANLVGAALSAHGHPAAAKLAQYVPALIPVVVFGLMLFLARNK